MVCAGMRAYSFLKDLFFDFLLMLCVIFGYICDSYMKTKYDLVNMKNFLNGNRGLSIIVGSDFLLLHLLMVKFFLFRCDGT